MEKDVERDKDAILAPKGCAEAVWLMGECLLAAKVPVDESRRVAGGNLYCHVGPDVRSEVRTRKLLARLQSGKVQVTNSHETHKARKRVRFLELLQTI